MSEMKNVEKLAEEELGSVAGGVTRNYLAAMDVMAGKNAGTRTVLLYNSATEETIPVVSDFRYEQLSDAVKNVLDRDILL